MEIVTVVLALLFAVLVGDWITRFVPIPPPLIQIALGVGLAIGPVPSVELDPHIFFLVFLPPLLFLDGWRIPKRDLKRDGATVLALALGLVLFTVVGIGFFINWLIPTMPLAVSFALAAVLAPTDPIAVSAVAARTPIPRRLMHILEGESLLNDASGLVCLRFAIAAALTGHFSLGEASLSFLWLALGGAAVGVALTFAITFAEDRVLTRGGRDPGAQTLFSLLIPFAVYLVAEAIHVSGILAAATAGIAMNYVENFGQALAPTRIRRTAVWDTVQLAANGAIFVLLGEQLPDIFKSAAQIVNAGDRHAFWALPLYVVAITAALVALRFAWVYVTIRLVLLRARFNGEKPVGLTWHLVASTALAGVKGAITLAGVLTLPFAMPDGKAVPRPRPRRVHRHGRDPAVPAAGDAAPAWPAAAPAPAGRAGARRGGGPRPRRRGRGGDGRDRGPEGSPARPRHEEGGRHRRQSFRRGRRQGHGALQPACRVHRRQRGGAVTLARGAAGGASLASRRAARRARRAV